MGAQSESLLSELDPLELELESEELLLALRRDGPPAGTVPAFSAGAGGTHNSVTHVRRDTYTTSFSAGAGGTHNSVTHIRRGDTEQCYTHTQGGHITVLHTYADTLRHTHTHTRHILDIDLTC